MVIMKVWNFFTSIKKKNENNGDGDYKEVAARNKEKIINKDVNNMKKECIKEFKRCIENGVTIAYVDFFLHTTHDFLDEISERVLKELKEENKNIEFSFCWRHCKNSYKGIKMVAM